MRHLVVALAATVLVLPQLFDAVSAGIYLSTAPEQYWAALNSSKLIYIGEGGVYITTAPFRRAARR
ncbi:hypothetical protein [Pyrobaculum sp.]|uniref:hypothetical protein n=1 Tax=Pyrobaculum sp. TaxID=2004705 RepID=UPI003170A016